MAEQNEVNRRKYLKGVAIAAGAVALPASTASGTPEATTVSIDTSNHDALQSATAELHSDGIKTTVEGVLSPGAPEVAAYDVVLENVNGSRSSSLEKATTRVVETPPPSVTSLTKEPEEDSGAEGFAFNRAEEAEITPMSTRRDWDYGNDFQGGLSTRASYGYEGRVARLDHTAYWDRKGSAVDWCNRRWYSRAGGANHWRNRSGLAALNFGGRDAYTKAYSNYEKNGFPSFDYFHRNHLWCKPDGQVRWKSVQYARNGDASELRHRAVTLYKDPRR